MPNIASENRPENPEPQTTETGTTSQLITPDIPTENRFLLLQDGKDTPFNRRQEISDLEINPSNNSPKARDTPPTPAVVNKAIFLCDSNGKFLDKRKLFPSGQQFKFFRCPKIEHVCTIQDEINQESEHPHLIVIHSGTNDLMHGSFLPVTIPPGQPRGQVQPFGPGGGELFEGVLSRGEGGGAIRK